MAFLTHLAEQSMQNWEVVSSLVVSLLKDFSAPNMVIEHITSKFVISFCFVFKENPMENAILWGKNISTIRHKYFSRKWAYMIINQETGT